MKLSDQRDFDLGLFGFGKDKPFYNSRKTTRTEGANTKPEDPGFTLDFNTILSILFLSSFLGLADTRY